MGCSRPDLSLFPLSTMICICMATAAESWRNHDQHSCARGLDFDLREDVSYGCAGLCQCWLVRQSGDMVWRRREWGSNTPTTSDAIHAQVRSFRVGPGNGRGSEISDDKHKSLSRRLMV